MSKGRDEMTQEEYYEQKRRIANYEVGLERVSKISEFRDILEKHLDCTVNNSKMGYRAGCNSIEIPSGIFQWGREAILSVINDKLAEMNKEMERI